MRGRWLFFTVLALFLGGIAAAIWAADSGLFTKFSVGPAGAEAGDSFESAADDLDILRDEVQQLSEEVSSALVALTERLERLEAGHRGLNQVHGRRSSSHAGRQP